MQVMISCPSNKLGLMGGGEQSDLQSVVQVF
jgi:hypothetical protein